MVVLYQLQWISPYNVSPKVNYYAIKMQKFWRRPGIRNFCVHFTVPQPTSVLIGNSIHQVGSTATLHCTVYLHQYSSYLSLPTTLTVELLKEITTVITRSIALSGSVTVHTSVFTILNVGVSNAGQYQCRATVRTTENNRIYSSPGISNNVNLQIQSNLQFCITYTSQIF